MIRRATRPLRAIRGLSEKCSALGLEARSALRAVIRGLSRRLPALTQTVVWTVVALTLGIVIGFAAIGLPPTGAFGLVAVAGLLLLWALPDLPAPPARSVRLLFVLALVIDLCVPNYYAIQVIGLPWITLRRLFAFPLIIVFALAIAGSSQVRRHIVGTMESARSMLFCIVGYYIFIGLSVLTSASPFASLSGMTETSLTWYVPWLAMLFVVNNEADLLKLLRLIGWCAIAVSLAGVLEFIVQHRYFIDVIPKPILSTMMENNPAFAAMVEMSSFRNGMYRASSIFSVSLSFGEFEAMVAPFGYTFFLYEETSRGRAFGLTIVLSSLAAIFVSGSRGAYVSFLISTVAFVVLWVVRTSKFDQRRSLAPSIVVVLAIAGFAAIILLILFWGRAHNMVIGGGMEAYSTEDRFLQWQAAWPKILQNPVTGNGFDVGAEVVGYTRGGDRPTLDSYVIALLVETGVPGFLLFSGAIAAGVWLGVREYLSDPTERGGLAGGLACALLAYAIDRLVLAQRENQTLLYLFLGALMTLARAKRDQRATEEIPPTFSPAAAEATR